MTFIPKNPLSFPKISYTPSTPPGTKGIFAKEDGFYEVDEFGNESKISSDGNGLSPTVQTYVDSKIASMVDSAPETLDTLNELSQALGDDPNFATTIATEIGKKADTSYVDEKDTEIHTEIAGMTMILEDMFRRVPQIEEDKADKTYVDEQIQTKAAPIEVFQDVYFNQIPDLQANKADKSYVEEKVADKVNKSYVDEQLKTKADDADYQNFKSGVGFMINAITKETIPLLDSKKADITYVDEQVSGFTAELNAALQEIIAIQEDLMTPDGDGVKY